MATSKLRYLLAFFTMLFCVAYCEHAKVLILGAGTAGIQAAGTFSENNFTDFLLIEGADYVGGRVKNGEIAGVTVGVGAQWTPPTHPKFTNLILNDWNLRASEINFSLTFRDSSTGLAIPQEEIGPVFYRLSLAQQNSVKIAQEILDNDKPDVSQRTALIKGNWTARTLLERTIEWLNFDFSSSEPISVTSLLHSAFHTAEGLSYITDSRGYPAIFEFMAPYLYQDETTFNNHVRLNQRVTTIDYSNDDIVTVTCEDGTEYTGEYIFVTFNLGVFQNNLVQTIPELPAWKTDILSQISSASYTAIYISFPERFWDNTEGIINVDERYDYYTWFQNLDFFGVYPKNTHILTTHVVGDGARRIEYKSDEEIKREIEELLQRMYGLDTTPEASEILVHSWLRDPLHMGAHTNRPAEVQSDATEKLQARVGRVFFGGEVTNDGRGGIGNAWESGIREMSKLLLCMEGGECPEYGDDDRKETGKPRKDCNVVNCHRP